MDHVTLYLVFRCPILWLEKWSNTRRSKSSITVKPTSGQSAGRLIKLSLYVFYAHWFILQHKGPPNKHERRLFVVSSEFQVNRASSRWTSPKYTCRIEGQMYACITLSIRTDALYVYILKAKQIRDMLYISDARWCPRTLNQYMSYMHYQWMKLKWTCL